MNPINVILVDDHLIVREGISMLIENDDEIKVVGEAENMANALILIEQKQPDVVLIDLDLGPESSLDAMDEIPLACDKTRILVLTGLTDENLHKTAIAKGAQGILMKNQAGTTLIRAIKKIHQGEAWIDRMLTAKILAENKLQTLQKSDLQDKLNSLSAREREIVKQIAEGLVNKEIARRLFVSEKTIRNSLTVIYGKLHVSNRLELAIYASRHGLNN